MVSSCGAVHSAYSSRMNGARILYVAYGESFFYEEIPEFFYRTGPYKSDVVYALQGELILTPPQPEQHHHCNSTYTRSNSTATVSESEPASFLSLLFPPHRAVHRLESYQMRCSRRLEYDIVRGIDGWMDRSGGTSGSSTVLHAARTTRALCNTYSIGNR